VSRILIDCLLCASWLAGAVALAACQPGEQESHADLEVGSCSTCRIRLTPQLRLDFTGAPVTPAGAAIVALDADHETFVVLAAPAWTELHEFDVDGRYVRSFGIAGDGPDEYARIDQIVFDESDSLWVFDSGNARVDVFTPELVRARSMPLEGTVSDVAVLHNDNLVIHGSDPLSGGTSIRLLGRDGTIVPFPHDARAAGGAGEARTMAAAEERAQLWIADYHEYRVQLWHTSGPLREIERAPPWFAQIEPALLARYADFVDARPAILDIALDYAGRMWVIGGTIDRQPPDPTTVQGRTNMNVEDWVDTVIEVLDPATGALVTSARFDFAPPSFLRDGLIYRVVLDAMAGDVWIDVSRLDLTEF
jgi:hypothetical protein